MLQEWNMRKQNAGAKPASEHQARGALTICVRIGKTEVAEDFRFDAFHFLCIGRVFVIVALGVQCAVHDHCLLYTSPSPRDS